MQTAPLSSSQKTEVLRRQAFKCNQCQTDLEPVGRAPPYFEQIKNEAMKGTSTATNFQALCPACHAMKSTPDSGKSSDEKKRHQRESDPNRSAKKFVKSGFDAKKF